MNKTVKYKIGIVFLVLAIASPLLVFVVPFLQEKNWLLKVKKIVKVFLKRLYKIVL